MQSQINITQWAVVDLKCRKNAHNLIALKVEKTEVLKLPFSIICFVMEDPEYAGIPIFDKLINSDKYCLTLLLRAQNCKAFAACWQLHQCVYIMTKTCSSLILKTFKNMTERTKKRKRASNKSTSCD